MSNPTVLEVADAKKKTVVVDAERENLLEEIRRQIVRDQDVPIKATDILPVEVENLTNEQLKNVVRNIQIYRSNTSSLLNTEGVISSLDKLLIYYSDNSFTIRRAVTDEYLKADLLELISSYIGEIPLVSRIVMRLMSHLESKQMDDDGETK